MTVRTDTAKLLTYTPKSYPTLDGAEERFITDELSKVQNAIGKLVQVVKLLEDRMNTNGLT
jgi:hypothetical protein